MALPQKSKYKKKQMLIDKLNKRSGLKNFNHLLIGLMH